MPQMKSKMSNQAPTDDVGTLTSKSSGIEFLKNSMEPRQDARVERREPVTKNDKS